MTTKRFTRIKVATDGVTTLEWTTHEDSETHTHSLVCKEPPARDFVIALDNLLPDVADIIEVPLGYVTEGMRVQAIALSMNEKTGARGAVVSALKTVKVANGPLVIHTPHLIGDTPADDDDDADDAPPVEDKRGRMPPGMWDRVLDVEREGWEYVEGKRAPKAQTDLFEEPGDDDDDDDRGADHTGGDPAPSPPTRRRRPRDPMAV